MEAYSQDLRDRVLAAYDEGGATQAELADAFRVSLSWLKKLLRRRRRTGSYAALPGGRGPHAKLQQPELRALAELVARAPDATLEELRAGLRVQLGVDASVPTVCRAARALRLTRKKSPCSPASVRPPSGSGSATASGGGSGRCRPPTASTSTRRAPTRP